LSKCAFCRTTSLLKPCRLAGRLRSTAYQVNWLRTSGILPDFHADAVENVMLLCEAHHRQFSRGFWKLAPCQEDTDLLTTFEEEDFEKRLRAWKESNGRDCLPRRVPSTDSLTGWLEVLPFDAHGPISIIGAIDMTSKPVRQVADTAKFFYASDARYHHRCRRRGKLPIYEFHLGASGTDTWAVMVDFLEALRDGFQPLTGRVRVVHERLLRLRNLYNRQLPNPRHAFT